MAGGEGEAGDGRCWARAGGRRGRVCSRGPWLRAVHGLGGCEQHTASGSIRWIWLLLYYCHCYCYCYCWSRKSIIHPRCRHCPPSPLLSPSRHLLSLRLISLALQARTKTGRVLHCQKTLNVPPAALLLLDHFRQVTTTATTTTTTAIPTATGAGACTATAVTTPIPPSPSSSPVVKSTLISSLRHRASDPLYHPLSTTPSPPSPARPLPLPLLLHTYINTAKLSSILLNPTSRLKFAGDPRPRQSPSTSAYSNMSLQPSNSKDARRRRSSSLVYKEPPESLEQLSDQSALPNLNVEWVNAKGEPSQPCTMRPLG